MIGVPNKFLYKRGGILDYAPSVAGPALGGYLGRAVGTRYGAPDLGALLGGITGGVTGHALSESLSSDDKVPPGAPYAMDTSTQDIPPWALAGARYLRPTMKMSAHEGMQDVVLGDIMGSAYPVMHGLKTRDWGGAGRQALGQTAGVAGGGLAGYGAGKVLSHFLGHDVNVPGVNIPLSTILSGLGATIGGVKGLQMARGQ